MNAIVSAGDAHISSIVAAYEVGTVTSKVSPVASFKACAITSPPVTMMFASTEGTNKTLIGCSGEPIAGPASVGAAVGSSVATSVGASVGAAVAGVPQALIIKDVVTKSVSKTNSERLFIFSPFSINIVNRF